MVNIVTLEDLQEFRRELVEEIRKLLTPRPAAERKWLKSNEVRSLLLISPGSLRHLRNSGVLPFTRVGGTFFYAYADIQKMLDDHKHDKNFLKKKVPSTFYDDPVEVSERKIKSTKKNKRTKTR